ncbi:MAG: ABC transporter ATP-binding protein [Candidatus Limnocylindria bacterium]
MTGTPAVLACHDLTVRYGSATAVDGVSLEVAAGESLALLGPSGSGKTTILSAIAGFIEPVAGRIELRGKIVAELGRSVPPERRRIGMVFQHYALWPHLSALETVAYPMRRGGAAPDAARAEAARLLDRLGLAKLAGRRPAELSGGEQQRVGLARAIARDPDLFLFDEPTAHLDTPLRAALQEELAARRASTGTAAVTATHDVGEALAVADRVVLLRDGRVVQVGTPRDVYERPVDVWAGRLTGPASLLGATILEPGTGDRPARLRIGNHEVALPSALDAQDVGEAQLLVRPDWVTLDGELPGTVEGLWYRGPHTDYRIASPGGRIDVREPGPPRFAPGAAVGWRLHRAWPMAAETGR